MCRELNSNLFAFFKNHFSISRTNSSHVSNSGSVSNLAQSTVAYVSETFKNIRTYKKVDLKTRHFYTVSEKRLANLHFFSEKWPNKAYFFFKNFVNTTKDAQLPKLSD